MNSLVFVCLLACLQSVLGQAIGYASGLNGLPCNGPGVPINNGLALGNALGANGIVPNPGSLSLAGMPINAVSPIGYGDVAVAGELPVGGSTAVVGNVPIIGFVTFEGIVPAGGTVSLVSNCGCNSPVY
ncbi:uncharacterized protein [Epargyreus clarus]|uniref:uncharacterized protein n=1 Tax=Epargyreus clarus TaxID=520877 RepID=UPI003C2EA8F3